MSESTPSTGEEMKGDSTTDGTEDSKIKVRVTISEAPDRDEVSPLPDRHFSTPEVGSRAPVGTERRYRSIAALSPSSEERPGSARSLVWKLAVVAAASAVMVGGASTLVLRPGAATAPKAPPTF